MVKLEDTIKWLVDGKGENVLRKKKIGVRKLNIYAKSEKRNIS